MVGSGKYNAVDIGNRLGGSVGGMLGNMIAPGIGGKVGGIAGNAIGSGLGQLFRSLTGFGEYTVHENSILYPDKVVPSFGDDSIRVKKREYICDLDSSTAFSNNFFAVNPGLSDSFPWLSSIANNYEQYRFNGLVFQYVSTSSDSIASTTNLGLGQVVMASDYNAADAAFVNLPQMLGAMFSNSGKPSDNIMHAVECATAEQAQKLYYVRSGDNPTGTDVRMYDLCNFQIATQNMPGVYTGMGQLWVSYDVTLCKSVQNNQLGFSLQSDHFQLVAPTVTTAYFGTSRTLREHSNLGCTVTGTKISFPPTISSGYFLITYDALGTSASLASPTMTGANCTALTKFNNDGSSGASNNGQTGTVYVDIHLWRIDARDATITFSGGTIPTAGTFGDLIITQVNGEIYS